MEYQLLTEEERDAIIVEFMKAQERDKFCHEINLQRYEAMLRTLPDGEWKNSIQKLRDETVERLGEVNSIIEATKPQVPPVERISKALQKLEARQVA